MVDKIVFAYKFTSLLMSCEWSKVWLTTILDKYDPNKGSKAFRISEKLVHPQSKEQAYSEVPYEEAELEIETNFVIW